MEDPEPLGRRAERVRESLVREGVRANLLAGVTPSEAAIVDAAAARGIEVVRSQRRDIDALREAAAVLLSELSVLGPRPGPMGYIRFRAALGVDQARSRLAPLPRDGGLASDRDLLHVTTAKPPLDQRKRRRLRSRNVTHFSSNSAGGVGLVVRLLARHAAVRRPRQPRSGRARAGVRAPRCALTRCSPALGVVA